MEAGRAHPRWQTDRPQELAVRSPGLVGAFVVALGACSSRPESNGLSCTESELVVAASDYTSSALVVVGRQGVSQVSGLDLGKDPVLASAGGFLLARDNELVFTLDPCGQPIAPISVHALATSRLKANPHDAAKADDGSTWVALYGVPKIAIVVGSAIGGTIDLSSFDPDGNPQAESIRISNGKAFVTLERLDDANLTAPSTRGSQMLRIDVATRQVESVIELAGRNPFGSMFASGSLFYLAEPRSFDRADEDLAGIEVFDPRTSTSHMLALEKDLGGSVVEVAVANGCGVAILAGPVHDVNPTSLVTFDPENGVRGSVVIASTGGFDLQGLAWRGDALFVGDRRATTNGYPVHVYERDSAAGSCTLRESNRTIALPQRPVALRPTQ